MYKKLSKFRIYSNSNGNRINVTSSDIQILADLTVDEVIQVGEYIGVPDSVIHKTPDDGLSGKTDEEKLGVKYSEIAEVINNPDNPKVSNEVHEKIKKLHRNNLHKFNIATYRKN